MILECLQRQHRKTKWVQMDRVLFASAALLSSALAMPSQAASWTVIDNLQTRACAYPVSPSAGAAVVQSACNTGDIQLWAVEYVDRGGAGTPQTAYFRLRNRFSGLCLDLASASASDGVRIVQKTCSGATSQQWEAPAVQVTLYNTSGYDPIKGTYAQGFSGYRNRFSGKCLDLDVAGGYLQQRSCADNQNQKWFIAD